MHVNFNIEKAVKALSFFKEVRVEANRIAWPSLKETNFAVMLVFVLAAIAGLFFLVADAAIYRIINFILGVGI